MGDVVRIEPAVDTRACPGCGYLLAQIAIEMARYNFKCPRCANYKMSEFQPLRLAPNREGWQ